MNENMDTKVEKLRPFTRFCITIGELPSSYLMSMTYYEQILWFTKYLQETVIPAINTNATAVEEIQEFLKTLDLQDEVDKKLDEMAESGELQEIIASYLNAKAIFCYDNVAGMKEATNLIDGSYAETLGYYSKNDGGNALYKVRQITNDDVVDEATIIELADDSLIAELIIKNDMNVECFGAKSGDNTFDNGGVINNALDKIGNKNVNLICKSDTYHFSTCIEFDKNISLIGNKTLFQFNAVDKGVLIGSTDDLTSRKALIKGITIKMASQLYGTGLSFTEGTALRLFNIQDSLIKDINIENEIANNICNGIWLRENCKNVVIDNCKTLISSGNVVGGSLWLWTYYAESILENINVKNCIFTQNTRDEIIAAWGNGTIKNITIEDNTFNENNVNNKVMSISFRNNSDNVKLYSNIFNQNSDVQNLISCGTTGKNYQFLNNTFIINKENLSTGNIFLINNNIAKILNNTFSSLAGYLPQIIDVNSGKCIVSENEFNNISNCIVNLNKDSENAEIILSNNNINCKVSPLYVRSSNHNVILMNNNKITLDSTTATTHLISFIRNSGSSDGSQVYAENNKVYGNVVNLVYGVSYANFVLRNNDINATSVYLVKRSDGTYDITMKTSVFENNNIVATTLNDTDVTQNATSRVFNNNIFNGVDITQVASSPVNTDPYYNIFRRLVPDYKIFNAASSSVLGYKKTGDNSYVAINI